MEQKEEGRVKREEEQQVWSWAAGTDRQLGTGRLQDELLPQLLHLPSLSAVGSISLLACGGAHVLAITSGGKLLTWGRVTSGQLGHSEMGNSPHPKLVMSLETYFITHASTGWNHSGFVSVFTCGDGSFGQLGHGDSGDEVYGFGSGKRGQLGISKDKIKSISLPERIFGFEGVKVTSIIANGDQSAALSADGHIYTWGKGFGGASSTHSPQSLPISLRFTKAAVGWNHALLLNTGGEVFMLGGNHHGVLGNPDKMTPGRLLADSGEAILNKVPGLEENRIMDIAAGAEHSVIVTDDGVIKTWGWGEHGLLRLGNTSDQTTQQVSDTILRKKLLQSGFTVVADLQCL